MNASSRCIIKNSISVLFLFISGLFYAQTPFITIWNTENPGMSADNQIFLTAFGDYDYVWKEVAQPENTGSGSNSGDLLLDLPHPGIYSLEILPTGELPFHQIQFDLNANDDAKKIIDVAQWGSTAWSSFEFAFAATQNLKITAEDVPDLSEAWSLSRAFLGSGLKVAPQINNWDVSHITDFTEVFRYTTDFNLNIDNWDLGNAETTIGMFFGAQKFNQPVASWDMSHVKNTIMMFALAEEFNQPMSNWDVGKVEKMNFMFWGAGNFNQPLNNWNTSSVEETEGMFLNASSFNQSLENWSLTNLYNANEMFINSAIDCINYSRSLRGWAENPETAPDVFITSTGLKYAPNAETYRSFLIEERNWQISGDELGDCALEIKEKERSGMKIYPNPVSQMLFLNSPQIMEEIQIFDLSGRSLKTQNFEKQTVELNLSNFSAGSYIIKVRLKNGITIRKKIVKK